MLWWHRAETVPLARERRRRLRYGAHVVRGHAVAWSCREDTATDGARVVGTVKADWCLMGLEGSGSAALKLRRPTDQ